LDRISQRIRDYRWDALPDAGGWRCGIGLDYTRKLCDYWLNEFDWRKQEQRLNRFPQFMATVDGVDIHFYHVRSSNPSAANNGRAILLTHGWPGSVFEFHNVIEPLAFPERFIGEGKVGGDAADAFDVIVPALPGFGFSGRPASPIGPRAIAKLFAKLMTDVLGYKSFVAQGGDWGSGVTAWLGFEHASVCRGIHLNMLMVQPALPPQTDEEKTWLQNMMAIQVQEGAYGQLQATKPQTLAFALMDSPVGIAAWIAEKFGGWTDVPRSADKTPDLSRFSFDDLLTNIMFYVATDSFATSAWIYFAMMQLEGSRTFPPGQRCETPTGFAAFPDPMLIPPPRSRVEKGYNLIHFTPMTQGG